MSEKIDVTNQLNILIKLQNIDSQIYKAKYELEKKPQELERLKSEFQSKAVSVKHAEEKIIALQLKKKEKEGGLNVKEENVRKLQAQLYQIKTNKEYAAMQKEIEGQKADKSAMEDEILLLMEEVDKGKLELAEERGKVAAEEVKLKEQEKQVMLELEEIQKRLQQFNAEREQLVPQVNKEVLKKYEKILASKNGLALVAVKNNACQGCHMSMPPQVISEIRLNDKFIICENCTRFLYIDGDAA